MKSEIKLHPKIEELNAECENLSEGLAGLIVERDRLKNKALPQIDVEYAAKFGEMIKCLLTLEYEARAMKRRIELVQKQINRGEGFVPHEIEEQVQTEFQTYLSKIREQEIKNREAAVLSQREFLSVGESREIQKIYRQLAKKLHPDFAENRSAKHHEIWLQVAAAYANSDLETLRALDLVIDALLQNETIQPVETSFESLEKRQEKLLSQTGKILTEITEIRQGEKFRLAEKLEDEIWCEEQREIFGSRIKSENDNLQRLTAIFQNLLAAVEAKDNASDEDWAEIII